MSYDPNYWGTICELDDEREVCPSCNGEGVDAWGETCLQCGGNGYVDSDSFAVFKSVGAVFASALITLGVVAYFVA